VDTGLTVGIDIGGTFTDVVALAEDGTLTTTKAATTPGALEEGVLTGLADLATAHGLAIEEFLGRVRYVKHGSTVATNALLTGRGVPVGLIMTAGFEDTPLIMRAVGRVDGLSDEQIRHVASVTKPEPLVARHRILGVHERVDSQGKVVVPMRAEELLAAAERLVTTEGVQALALSFLNSWANPVHERRAAELIRSSPVTRDVYLSTGHELSQRAGEYARTNSAVANSSVGPVVNTYLRRLNDRLRTDGFTGAFLIMQGNGGLADWQSIRPIDMLQSGPAGGMRASQVFADRLGHSQVLTGDMGGTSFDVGLVVNGSFGYADEPVFDRYRLALPLADVKSIGAGGGTIARYEDGAGLRVGPDSAGSDPGPACYGRGGELPTVTDTNVIIGVIDPENFLGGRQTLDRGRAFAALEQHVARPMGRDIQEAAAGILQITDNRLGDILRREVVQSGYLPEDFVIYSFGGAGGSHAAQYARILGVHRVYVFRQASVFSALGIAMADILSTRVASCKLLLTQSLQDVVGRVDELREELVGAVRRSLSDLGDVAAADLEFELFLGMRFLRQSSHVEVPYPVDLLRSRDVDSLERAFRTRYAAMYGEGTDGARDDIEVSSIRLDAIHRVPKPLIVPPPAVAGSDIRRTREVHLAGGPVPVQVADLDSLAGGTWLSGPAVIEATDTTVLVPADSRAVVDDFRTVVVHVGACSDACGAPADDSTATGAN
jgi:N-methylhydantoinase A